MRNLNKKVSNDFKSGKKISKAAFAALLCSLCALWLCDRKENRADAAPSVQTASKIETKAETKQNAALAAEFDKLKTRQKKSPSLSDKFPFGADSIALEKIYKSLTRSYGGLGDLERTRILQYVTDIPCSEKIPLSSGKKRVSFRIKSHRLYETEFDYIGLCADKYDEAVGELKAVYGAPKSENTLTLAAAEPFSSRTAKDAVWETSDFSVNVRLREDELAADKRKITSLFVTFRAKDSALKASASGLGGGADKVVLMSDADIKAAGKTATVAFLPEISATMSATNELPNAAGTLNPDYSKLFSTVAQAFAGAHIKIAALNSPLVTACENKALAFPSPPDLVESFVSSGFAAAFAGPGIKLCGDAGANATLRLLEASQIKVVLPNAEPAFVEAEGLKAALIAFETPPPGKGFEAALDKMKSLAALYSAKADFLIAGLIWEKPGYCPTEGTRRAAEALLNGGAKIVFGYGGGSLSGMLTHGGGAAFFGGGAIIPPSLVEDPEGVIIRCALNRKGLVDYEPIPFLAGENYILPRLTSGKLTKHVVYRFGALSQNCLNKTPPKEALTPFYKTKR